MSTDKLSKCFMNGKSCIYERELDSAKDECRKTRTEKRAFTIMPFEKKLNLLYKLEVAPFFRRGGLDLDSDYRCTIERADDITRTGFIICEKICKKIQEADYIVADLSFDNPNVFYELGLASALQKEIIPICINDNPDKNKRREDYLKKQLNLPKLLFYPYFDVIEQKIKDFSWKPKKYFSGTMYTSGNIVILEAYNHNIKSSIENEEKYSFGKLCQTTVNTAVSQIFSIENMNQEQKTELKKLYKDKLEQNTPILLNSRSSYGDVSRACENAACFLVDISDHNEISNFFWLGYIHGLGGNVIPITSYNMADSSSKNISPFDIRALWQISFDEENPIDLLNSLKDILEHIYLQKAKNLDKESFWKDILKNNQVSIFLGSIYLGQQRRNTIGDWDYRTAAEITSYLSTSKETMKITLESPISKLESQIKDEDMESYIDSLKKQLNNKNCIIIASPDVNDLAEIALCEILDQKPFTLITETSNKFKGYIAYKKYKPNPDDSKNQTRKNPLPNAFYMREEGEQDERGFRIRESSRADKEIVNPHYNPDNELTAHDKPYNSNDELSTDDKTDCVHILSGQLVVAKNLTTDKWIVIISGISGPATLGIAQMLTGCMYEEFTVKKIKAPDDESGKKKYLEDLKKIEDKIKYVEDKTVKPDRSGSYGKASTAVQYNNLSEHMLNQINDIIKSEVEKKSGTFRGVNVLINVYVYYPSTKENGFYEHDDRKVVIWEFTDVESSITNWYNPNNLSCYMPI